MPLPTIFPRSSTPYGYTRDVVSYNMPRTLLSVSIDGKVFYGVVRLKIPTPDYRRHGFTPISIMQGIGRCPKRRYYSFCHQKDVIFTNLPTHAVLGSERLITSI